MKRTIAQLLSLLALALSESTYAQKIDECVNANPNNVSDVRRCISKMPAHIISFIAANSCRLGKKGISEAQGHRDEKSSTIPSCRVISDALMAQNDKRPDWHAHIDYDGSQQQLNKSLAAVLAQPVYAPQKKTGGTCESGRYMAMTFPDSSDVLQGAKVSLTCDMINQAFLANGSKMIGAECMHYKPDDESHMEKCMTDIVSKVRQQGKPIPSCDEGRKIYQELVQTGNAEQPKDYLQPACSSMNSVIAKIYENAAIAPTPTAQTPAPVQQPIPSQPQPQPQPVVAKPFVTTPAPAPITQPARQPVQTPPTHQPAAVVTHQPSAPQETSEQRRERKAEEKMEKMEKVQSGLNTVNQVMGLFGGGAGNATTNQATANQTAATETPPPEQETKDERKARETNETVNQAAETINTLKGLFGK